MPIEMTCPGCGKKLRLAEEHAGKHARCPACQMVFVVPQANATETPAPSFSQSDKPFASEGKPGLSLPNPYGDSAPQTGPFASTPNQPSTFQQPNPYSAPQAYGGYAPSSTNADNPAAMIMGIVTLVSAVLSVLSLCCCFGWLLTLVTFPCGIIGTILAFQLPPEKRSIPLGLNISGMALAVLIIIGTFVLHFAIALNQQDFQ